MNVDKDFCPVCWHIEITAFNDGDVEFSCLDESKSRTRTVRFLGHKAPRKHLDLYDLRNLVTTGALFNLEGELMIQGYCNAWFMRCKVIGLASTHKHTHMQIQNHRGFCVFGFVKWFSTSFSLSMHPLPFLSSEKAD